jgi:hypothetical protein
MSQQVAHWIDAIDWSQTLAFLTVCGLLYKVIRWYHNSLKSEIVSRVTSLSDQILSNREHNELITSKISTDLKTHTDFDDKRFSEISQTQQRTNELLSRVDTKVQLLVDNKIK